MRWLTVANAALASCRTASKLLLKCNNCDSFTNFLSSGGDFRGKLHVGSSMIPKWTDLMYYSVLGARLMRVGWAKLHLYHAFLNIPGPISSRNFHLVQVDILTAAKVVPHESMLIAVDELRLLHNTPSTSKHVTAVGTFDGLISSAPGNLVGVLALLLRSCNHSRDG